MKRIGGWRDYSGKNRLNGKTQMGVDRMGDVESKESICTNRLKRENWTTFPEIQARLT